MTLLNHQLLLRSLAHLSSFLLILLNSQLLLHHPGSIHAGVSHMAYRPLCMTAINSHKFYESQLTKFMGFYHVGSS